MSIKLWCQVEYGRVSLECDEVALCVTKRPSRKEQGKVRRRCRGRDHGDGDKEEARVASVTKRGVAAAGAELGAGYLGEAARPGLGAL
jgi:hypothetical protein